LPEIPSFFNKEDFLGALLPGYIGVILGMVILFPEVVPWNNNSGSLPLDFFSAVVFLVAGPAVGYTLRQIHTIFYNIRYYQNRKHYIRYSIKLRYKLSDIERETLNMSEARYFFNTSTGIVLLMIGAYFSYLNGLSFEWGSIPIMALSLFFFVGAYVENHSNWLPQMDQFYEKYKNDLT